MCSLVSVYGPSVTSTLPSGCFRTVFALAAGEMPQANFLAPASNQFTVKRVDLFDHGFVEGSFVDTRFQ